MGMGFAKCSWNGNDKTDLGDWILCQATRIGNSESTSKKPNELSWWHLGTNLRLSPRSIDIRYMKRQCQIFPPLNIPFYVYHIVPVYSDSTVKEGWLGWLGCTVDTWSWPLVRCRLGFSPLIGPKWIHRARRGGQVIRVRCNPWSHRVQCSMIAFP